MKEKVDVFNQVLEVGDFVIRAASTSFIPCKIHEIRRNVHNNILTIVLIHPWCKSEGVWVVKRKVVYPSQELLKVYAGELKHYCGERDQWDDGYIEQLLKL